MLRTTGAHHRDAYFWGLHSGAELDLLIQHGGKQLGFEVKLTQSPKVMPSMRSAIEALSLDHLYVVCHVTGQPWQLAEKISAIPVSALGKFPY